MRAATARRHDHLRRLSEAVIARHYREPLTVAAIARRLGISPRALQRAYAHAGRTSVAEQLRAARLSAAAELLGEQPIAVADVARIVGFRSASAFAAAFARRYGLSPARYRAEARAARARRAPAGRRLIPPPTGATGRGS